MLSTKLRRRTLSKFSLAVDLHILETSFSISLSLGRQTMRSIAINSALFVRSLSNCYNAAASIQRYNSSDFLSNYPPFLSSRDSPACPYVNERKKRGTSRKRPILSRRQFLGQTTKDEETRRTFKTRLYAEKLYTAK